MHNSNIWHVKNQIIHQNRWASQCQKLSLNFSVGATVLGESRKNRNRLQSESTLSQYNITITYNQFNINTKRMEGSKNTKIRAPLYSIYQASEELLNSLHPRKKGQDKSEIQLLSTLSTQSKGDACSRTSNIFSSGRRASITSTASSSNNGRALFQGNKKVP